MLAKSKILYFTNFYLKFVNNINFFLYLTDFNLRVVGKINKIYLKANSFIVTRLILGLRGRSQTTFTKFGFYWPPTPLCLHFLWYESLQKVNFFDHLPLSSCKRSLWTAPKLNPPIMRVSYNFVGPLWPWTLNGIANLLISR